MARRIYPMVLVLTLALVSSLAVCGGLLMATLNTLFSEQVETGERQSAERQMGYLKEVVAPMLWAYDREGIQAVGRVLAQSDQILGVSLTTDLGEVLFQASRPGVPLETLTSPMVYRESAIGTLTLVFDSRGLSDKVTAIRWSSLIIFAVFLFVLALATPLVLKATVLRPFNRLSGRLTQDRGTGAFPYLPLPSSSIREIRLLEEALASLNQAVVRHVEDLETRVRERTQDLKEAQDRVVRAETLATLGQLAAGIAHELNTPLGALGSTVHFLETQWRDALIPLVARDLTIPGHPDTEAFLREAGTLAADLGNLPSSAQRRAHRARWKTLGGDPGLAVADVLCESALSARLEEMAAWPSDHPALAAVTLVASWRRSLAILQTAAEKGASVVSALQSQVHQSPQRSPRPLDLRREVGQALVLLQNKIKAGVQVHIEAPEEVWAFGDRDELSKVWLNLLLNAVQAMDGKGELVVTLGAQDGWAWAAFTNNGPAIDPEVLPHIFDPFFTTKSTGMGLGLAISRRAIEDNQGRLEVESVPERTTFRVFLREGAQGTQ